MKRTDCLPRACRLLFLASLLAVSPSGEERTFAATARPQEAEDRFTRTLRIGSAGSFTLSNISGNILVRGADGEEVVIRATKKGDPELFDSVEIDVRHTGDRVRVETHHGRRSGSGHAGRHPGREGVSVDYDVSVPHGTAVSLESVSGDVRLSDVRGESRVKSVSGDVRASNVGGLVMASSVSGNVEIEAASGSLDVEVASVSGDVTVSGLHAPELKLSSVSGDVVVEGAECERVDIESVSGDARYSGSIAPSGRYGFSSHSGDVTLRLPADAGFELDAETFSGEIQTDFTLTASRMGRRNLRGVAGDGSAFIEASSFSGDVRVTKR